MPTTSTTPRPASRDRSSAGVAINGLVVVSNRLPFRAVQRAGALAFVRSPGGLVAALEPALERMGGDWVGWPGVERERLPRRDPPAMPDTPGVRYRPVQLTAADLDAYYAGFSNNTLWPLFHYFVGRTRFDADNWRAYERVNRRFAREAAASGDASGLVWVHDYQLLRVPLHLRRRQPLRPVMFFLHIPFPAYDVFRTLPWSRELMRGMLGADLVGFHTGDYVDHFLRCAERLLGCETDRAAGLVQYEGRQVTVQALPIGIDVASIERVVREGRAARRRPVIRVLGVDRLDYTKGIPQRLLAIERFFERHPRYRHRVVYTQVAVPSREHVDEYRVLKRLTDELVGRINGRFADGVWSPIRYLVRSLAPDDLFRLYRDSDVALVTPLRDGMNLVAKEYVAAQVGDPGVLVLSELAGAAAELQEALTVNPHDLDGMADAIERAITMPVDERRARMSALRDRVRGNAIETWVERCLVAATGAWQAGRAGGAPVERVKRRLAPWLAARPETVLFLDFDGTLTPLVDRPEDAALSDAARQVLQEAVRAPQLDLVIVSGRSLDDVRVRVGVEGVTYVGDHGFEIDGPGLRYRHPEAPRWRRAMDRAARALDRLAIPGSQVERKAVTVSFHVRRVAPAARRGAVAAARAALKAQGLRVTSGRLVLEGRPPVDWHKGHGVLEVLARRHGSEWPAHVRALYVGDDRTDEDAFEALHGIGRSILVAAAGGRSSAADQTLPDPEAVLQLVRWLAAEGFAARTARP